MIEATKDLSKIDFTAGALLLVNKPLTWTSFDVCNKLRGALKFFLKKKKYKVGHTGTLDPLADGLLQICIGKMTKSINTLQVMDKEYTGNFFLGATTPSYDGESETDAEFPTDHITEALIRTTVEKFIGPQEQLPPIFSAIKIDGVPLYKLARRGEKKELKPRPITIHEFEITSWDLPTIGFRVKCSKGTYIRSLAHDFGKAMNSGAYLTKLTRTKIGDYDLKDAWEIEELVDSFKKTIEETAS